MHCSAQLQAYLQGLDAQDEQGSSAERHLISESDEPQCSRQASLIARLEAAVYAATTVALESSVRQVDAVWTEEMIWFQAPQLPPPPPQPSQPLQPPSSPSSSSSGQWRSTLLPGIPARLVAWVLGIVSLGVVPLLLHLLGSAIKASLARLRAQVASAQCTTIQVIAGIRKIQLTCLGRQLLHPLAPLCGGTLSEDNEREAERSMRSLGLFDARAALEGALLALQADIVMEASTPSTHGRGDWVGLGEGRTSGRAQRASSRLQALASAALTSQIDAAMADLVAAVRDGTPLARLAALVVLPLRAHALVSAVGKYERSLQSIRRGLCADLALQGMPIIPVLSFPSASAEMLDTLDPTEVLARRAGGRYLEARAGLLHLRARVEAVQSKLWLCERLLCEPAVLEVLASEGGGAAACVRAQCGVERAVAVLLGRRAQGEGDMVGEAEGEEGELLHLLPDREEYSHLCRLLACVRDAVARAVPGGEGPVPKTDPAALPAEAQAAPAKAAPKKPSDVGEEPRALAVYEDGDVSEARAPCESFGPGLCLPDLHTGAIDVYAGRSSAQHEAAVSGSAGDEANAHDAARRRGMAQSMVRELQARIRLRAAPRQERVLRVLAGEGPCDEGADEADEADESGVSAGSAQPREQMGPDLLLLRGGGAHMALLSLELKALMVPRGGPSEEILGDDDDDE